MENIILTNNKNLRLVGVEVGVLSTLRLELPQVNASATDVEVIVTNGETHNAYSAAYDSTVHRWQCDIASYQFPTVGKQTYEVAYKVEGKQFWDGKGWIEIVPATTSGIVPQPQPGPQRYAVVSVNGYYADNTGAVRIPRTFIASNSPVTTEGYMEGDIYFNKDTGATWTLCDVSGTLVWVFNYSNYYTKAETDEQIDRVAAYYITYDAQGNSFPTRAALLNAQTYYSGGAPRTPTRNDYAVVLADETHDGAEWRYIYAVADGQTTGQWEPQYPVDGVIILDNSVTRTSANGVKSSGIWGAIWGALASLPTGFTSLYDWCVSQLAGKASTADATLAERYGSTETAQWTITYPQEWAHGTVSITWFDEFSPIGWVAGCDGDRFGPFSENPNATTLTGEVFGETITATRVALPGYQLGSQSDKPLASEAEAEALRTAVAAKYAKPSGGIPATDLAAAVQTSLGKADTALQASDAEVALSQKQDRYTAWTVTKADPQAPDATVEWMGGYWKFVSGGEVVGDSDNDNPAATSIDDGMGTYSATRSVIIDGKANRASPATAGNLAALDANGNPTDSGVKASDKLDSASAAPAFSSDSSVSYAVGSHCVYNGKLYKCTTATTGGTWVAGSWAEDTMTDPDAVLDITAQNQLRVVAKDGTLLWAQGYDLASTSSATLACDAANNFTFADGATTQAFALPTAPTGKVGDFGLDIDNSANASAATMTLTGLDSAFSVVVPEGESLNDMLAIAAGELARFYITLSTFRVNNLPTWHIVKQVVENGGAQS